MHNLLNNIIQQVNDAQELHQALRIIVEQVKQALAVNVCSIYLIDDKTRELVLKASDGLLDASIGTVRLRFNKGLVGLVAERSKPINLANAHKHPRYHYFSETGEEAFHGFLGVPIIQHGDTLGVLVIQQLISRRFTEEIVTFVTTIATQLASAISHAKAIDEINALNNHSLCISETALKGIPCAPGIAIGSAFVIVPKISIEGIPDKEIDDTHKENQRFIMAIEAVKNGIKTLIKDSSNSLPDSCLSLLDAYLLMLDSKSLIGAISEEIFSGNWAPGALRKIIMEYTHTFNEMDDIYLRQRAEDVRDLALRILKQLQQRTETKSYPDKVILVGNELSALMLAEIPQNKLSGVVARKGASTSHTAILASAFGVPAVLGIDDLPVEHVNGLTIIVDGYSGHIYINASKKITTEYKRLENEDKDLTQSLWDMRNLPSITKDGVPITINANTGIISDISPALSSGAAGVGLYRTEFSFLEKDFFPGEEEQQLVYQHVLKSFSPCPVTMRTLDVGGDKTLSYFPIEEENPFLGWRGIRISLDHPEIFLIQVRAMMRASNGLNNLKILIPMITTLPEIDNAISLIEKAHNELTEEGLNIPLPAIGAMIEVPSMIFQIDALSKRVDFLSIGTNDLTQYLLAVDRNNARVAYLYDSLQPSVIAAINMIVNSARNNKITITVCGEIASDPMAVLLLMGMGVDSLSMNALSMPRIKWLIRNISTHDAKDILLKALLMEDARSIRTFLSQVLENMGLGGLVRAGS